MDLTQVTLHNNSILVSIGHVAQAGDEKTINGFVVGKHEHSELPTYGKVLAVAPGLEEKVAPGDYVSFPVQGILRMVDFPGKDPKDRVVTMRFDAVDIIIRRINDKQ